MCATLITRFPGFTECNIQAFLQLYRGFPGTNITPKLHALEDHIVLWIRQWGVGLGFLSEQGAESIHANFNSMMWTYNNIRNPVERMERVLKEHYLRTAPSNIAAIPAIQKRKRKLSE